MNRFCQGAVKLSMSELRKKAKRPEDEVNEANSSTHARVMESWSSLWQERGVRVQSFHYGCGQATNHGHQTTWLILGTWAQASSIAHVMPWYNLISHDFALALMCPSSSSLLECLCICITWKLWYPTTVWLSSAYSCIHSPDAPMDQGTLHQIVCYT